MQKERPLEIAQPVNKEVQQAKQFYVEKNAEIEDLIKKVMEKEKPQVQKAHLTMRMKVFRSNDKTLGYP